MNEVKTPKKPLIVYYAIAILVVLLINTLLVPMVSQARVKYVDYGTFIQMTEEDKISEVQVQDNQIVFITKEDEANKNAVYYRTGKMDDPELTSRLSEHGVRFDKEIVEETSPLLSFLLSFVFPIVLFIALGQLLTRQLMKRMGGGKDAMSFGMGNSNAKVYVKDSAGSIKFDDVAGEDEAKENLSEIVNYLHDPSKYRDIGASMPKGILLVGPPGTGKTMLAKAVAGEANVPFFSISGSEFVEMFVGMGASKVRDLFKQAKEKAPCIVFIDEIDAIGKKRDGGKFGGGNDEREQTLNQLLAEIDGFDSSKGVVILAATNRPEILDKALLRAGRFDRRIIVDRPNLQGRYQTLRVHTKNIKLAEDVDLHKIAQATAGAVGADLANLVNEAALRAVRLGRKTVNQQDLLVSFETVIAGTEKKGTVLTDMEKRIVSYHEVGHALVAALQKHTQPVSKITIVPHTSGALGYTMQMPEEEKFLSSREELLVELQTLLGGRAAEQVVFGISTTGAANDIERATDLARKMVTQYGMSEKFGLMALSTVQSQYLDGAATMNCADSTASEVDQEVQKLLSSCFEQAKALLREHRALLDEIALYLLQKETITGDEFMVYVNAENRKLEAPKDEAEASDAEAAPAEDAADKTDENPNPTEGA